MECRNDWKQTCLSEKLSCLKRYIYLSKQNCQFFVPDSPRLMEEQSLYDQKVIVWCVVCTDMIMGRHFWRRWWSECKCQCGALSKHDNGFSDGHSSWKWQSDGTQLDSLQPLFSGWIILKNGDFDWSPRLPDWKSPGFYLYGFSSGPVVESFFPIGPVAIKWIETHVFLNSQEKIRFDQLTTEWRPFLLGNNSHQYRVCDCM